MIEKVMSSYWGVLRLHFEPGQIARNRGVEVDHTRLVELQQRDNGEGLTQGANFKERRV